MMDKRETNPPIPSPSPPTITTITTAAKFEESSRKPQLITVVSGGGGGNGGDRLKRDEWSEGAVSTLLEAYESKWILRNRAKLKGQDWEDIARFVSSRSDNTKSPKTQTQCKNKIESMKKRYRSESAVDASSSSWPLFPRLDLLLRGTSTAAATAPLLPPPPPPPPEPQLPLQQVPVSLPPLLPNPPLIIVELPLPRPVPPVNAPPELNGGEVRRIKEDFIEAKISSDHESSDKNAMETDSSTPALYSEKEKSNSRKTEPKLEKKRKRKSTVDYNIADSIRWLAKVMVRSEQARMDTMKEVEKMRAEAEVKRGEMDLKRTQIIANTQLEIAKIFASCTGKGVDSSLRIGRN